MKGRLRRQWEQAVAQHPFLRLVQHFAQRTVGGRDAASDIDLGIGGALVLLAAPGAFTSFVLLQKYSSLMQWFRGDLHFNVYRASIPDEYFFVVYSMAVTGLVTLLRWDHLLPGRRDFMNLAPLPLPLRSIFLANVVALAGTALLFAVDVNAASSFFFPIFVTNQLASTAATFQFAEAHIIAVLGMSAFIFLALLAVQGSLMALLPDTVYRRVSLMIRTVLLVFFFGILISAFLLPLSVLNFRFGSRMAGTWWPPIWFVSLYESQLPELKSQSMLPASVALWAIVLAVIAGVFSFSLSYRRYFLRISERSEGPARSSRVHWLSLEWLTPMWRVWIGNGSETAVFKFALKTLLRNDTHLLFLGLWAGIGIVLSLEALNSGKNGLSSGDIPIGALLAAPLILAYFLVIGLRFIFDIPAALEANWLFRLAAAEGTISFQAISRKLMILFTLPWLAGVWFPFALLRLGWISASLSLVMDCLIVLLGCELAILRCSKIPFTCSFTADRDRMLKVVVSSLLVLILVIPILVGMEGRIIRHPFQIIFYGGVAISILTVLRKRLRNETKAAIFEDKGFEAFALLHLIGD